MLSSLRPIGITASFLAAAVSIGCSLFSQKEAAPPDSDEPTPTHYSPLLHEALTSSPAGLSCHPLDVLYPPPASLPERPSEPKPAGDDVVWAPGYWSWNTSEDNWLWVRGVWVHAPRGHRWTPGYWSIVADGWRWIPGSWAADPPYSPPPPATLAYTPNTAWYDNSGLGLFAGYGMWWPMYPYRHFHFLHHDNQTAPVAVASGPHSGEHVPFPLPHLASNIHDAPATLPHLDMASVFASVPKPLASDFNPPQNFEVHTAHPLLALHPGSHEHVQRISSLFSTTHLQAALHEHMIAHGDFAAHSVALQHGAEHASSSHSSGGHGGGGHGR